MLTFRRLFINGTFPIDLYYLIVFTQSLGRSIHAKIDEIFIECYKKSLLNVNILYPPTNDADTMVMTTYTMFEEGCVRLTRRDLGILSECGYEMGDSLEDIYPTKGTNMNKCTIVVATFPSEPLVIVLSPSNTTHDAVVEGIEIELMHQMAKALNSTVRFRMPADNQKRGVIRWNGTTTGCFNMVNLFDLGFILHSIESGSFTFQVMTGEANLTVGTYAYKALSNFFFTPSYPYMQLQLGFTITLGNDIQSPIEKLLAPFQEYLWLSLGICLCAAIGVILFSKQLDPARRHFIIGGKMNRTPMYNMMILLLGGGIGNRRLNKLKYFGTFARSLTLIWLLVTLVMRGSYQGALFGFLQRQVIESPYETTTKIFRSDCNLIIMSTAATSLDAFDLDKSRYILYDYSQQIAFQQIHDDDLRGVVYSNNMQTGYFNLLNSNRRRLRMTKDRLYLLPIVMYFSKNSYLQPLFDSKLRLFSESGLLDYWSKQYSDETLRSKYQKREPTTLEIHSIVGLLQICGALIVLSLIVVSLELLSPKIVILKRTMEYFTY